MTHSSQLTALVVGPFVSPILFRVQNVPAELILEGTLGGVFVNKLEFLLAAEETGVADTQPERVSSLL